MLVPKEPKLSDILIESWSKLVVVTIVEASFVFTSKTENTAKIDF